MGERQKEEKKKWGKKLVRVTMVLQLVGRNMAPKKNHDRFGTTPQGVQIQGLMLQK